MAFTFDQVFAADPANPANIAQNAAITIFAPGDPTMAPLTITDPNGAPLANPLTVNANGFGSAFMHATLDRVAWAGGGFTGYFTSYEGIKNVAIAAQTAAEAAQAEAASAGAGVVDAANAAMAATVADADAAATAAEASAAQAAEIAITRYSALAKNPDTLIAGAVTLDISDQVVSAVVEWPDGTPGTLTITARDSLGSVLSYNVTYGSPVTRTYTQPTITRNSNGAPTNVPQIVVS
jgi:hypothetical protein